MKVYVIFDPLYEKNHSVYRDYQKAWDKCEELNKQERKDSSYHYEAQDFEVIDDEETDHIEECDCLGLSHRQDCKFWVMPF